MDMSYLMLRGDVWWYNRRIPSKYTHLDTRGRIRKSLDTYAKEEACLLRDKLVEADNQYWAALALDALGDGEGQVGAQTRYAAAVARAEAAGFSYRPVLEIAQDIPIAQTVERVLAIKDGNEEAASVQALLGGAERPQVKISEALEIYFNEIALDEQVYKSAAQKASWRKVKLLAVSRHRLCLRFRSVLREGFRSS